jgi:hypothetical protein
VSRQEKVRALTLEMAAGLGVQKGAQAESAVSAMYPWASAIIDAETALKRGNKALRKAARQRRQIAREVARIRTTIQALAAAPEATHPTARTPGPRLDVYVAPEPVPVYQVNGSGVYERE